MAKIYFPITMLQNFNNDTIQCCNTILDYALYRKYISYKEVPEYEFESVKQTITNELDMTSSLNQQDFEYLIKRFSSLNPHVPFAHASSNTIFEFRDAEQEGNPKSDFEKACFLCYCSLNSIQGDSKFNKTNNCFVASRMAGYAKKTTDLPDFIKEWITRRRFERIKRELQDNWHLSYYTIKGMHGFYFSFSLSFEKLVVLVTEKITRSRKLKLKRDLFAKMFATPKSRDFILHCSVTGIIDMQKDFDFLVDFLSYWLYEQNGIYRFETMKNYSWEDYKEHYLKQTKAKDEFQQTSTIYDLDSNPL